MSIDVKTERHLLDERIRKLVSRVRTRNMLRIRDRQYALAFPNCASGAVRGRVAAGGRVKPHDLFVNH